MNAGTVKVDALGFAESAKSISGVIEHQVYSAMVGVRRARALLRLVKESIEGRGCDLSHDDVSEVADLIDTALEVLPHHYNDVYDPVHVGLGKLSKEHGEQVNSTHALARIVEAMAVAAKPDVTVAELESQAKTVYAMAQKNEAYMSDWETLRDAIKARGFRVLEGKDDGADLGPSVVSSEMVKSARGNVQRIMREIKAESS